MIDLYINIKKGRIGLGMTQSELAAKTGYADKSMIARIEKGEIDLSQSKIVLFAKALGTSPAHLMGWDTDDKPLSMEEARLISDFRNLNARGRTKAKEYVHDLTENQKYTDPGNM